MFKSLFYKLFFSFQEEIFNKISKSIQSAPLQLKPIKTPAHIRAHLSGASGNQFRRCSTSSDSSYSAPRRHLPSAVSRGIESFIVTPALDDSNFDSLVKILSDPLQMAREQTTGMLSTSNSADLLSISPIFGKPFDTQSLVEDDLTRGIRNINYDIEFIDSPENSMAEEIAEIRKYSSIANEVSKTEGGSGMSMSKSDLEEFDPLMIKDKGIELAQETNLTRSLIDESPNDLLLENPLLPIKHDYTLSSQTSKIQFVSCETGTPPSKK